MLDDAAIFLISLLPFQMYYKLVGEFAKWSVRLIWLQSLADKSTYYLCMYFSLLDIQEEDQRYISQRQIKQMMTMMTGLVEAGGVLSGNSDSYMLL